MYALAKPSDAILTPTDVFNWKFWFYHPNNALGLQILSNFANDYGDGTKGTDNDDRVGKKKSYSKRYNACSYETRNYYNFIVDFSISNATNL
jgi:1,4-dihydroxy-2-naphthoate octaprenyltransferase